MFTTDELNSIRPILIRIYIGFVLILFLFTEPAIALVGSLSYGFFLVSMISWKMNPLERILSTCLWGQVGLLGAIFTTPIWGYVAATIVVLFISSRYAPITSVTNPFYWVKKVFPHEQ